MPSDLDNLKTFFALVTFERMGQSNEVLSSELQGACGWLAVSAKSNDPTEIHGIINTALKAHDLRVLEVDNITEFLLDDFCDDFDTHLGDNIRNWEPFKRVVWGTIHVYYADGEA